MQTSNVMIECGIDYLTLSSSQDGSVSRETYARLKNVHLERDWGGQSGIEERDWRWNGYSGKQFGKLLWGCRPDGSILRVSSSSADTIGRAMVGLDWRASRVDFQATVRLAGCTVDAHIKDMAQRAVLARAGANGRPWKIAHINGYGSGDTLNVGSRSSDIYMRLYNKQAETDSTDYLQCVRLEIEMKDQRARNAFWAWQCRSDKDSYCLEVLQAAAALRGVETLQGLASEGGLLPVGRHARTDLDSKLAWLHSTVKPTVDKLCAAGWKEDVLRALGLSDDTDLPVAQRVFV